MGTTCDQACSAALRAYSIGLRYISVQHVLRLREHAKHACMPNVSSSIQGYCSCFGLTAQLEISSMHAIHVHLLRRSFICASAQLLPFGFDCSCRPLPMTAAVALPL